MTRDQNEAGTDFHDSDDRSGRLFDLRYLIGGLLGVYGVVLVIVGLTDSSAALARASGVRINLWMGLGMLALGLLFLLWAVVRPLRSTGPSAAAQADTDPDPAGAGPGTAAGADSPPVSDTAGPAGRRRTSGGGPASGS